MVVALVAVLAVPAAPALGDVAFVPTPSYLYLDAQPVASRGCAGTTPELGFSAVTPTNGTADAIPYQGPSTALASCAQFFRFTSSSPFTLGSAVAVNVWIGCNAPTIAMDIPQRAAYQFVLYRNGTQIGTYSPDANVSVPSPCWDQSIHPAVTRLTGVVRTSAVSFSAGDPLELAVALFGRGQPGGTVYILANGSDYASSISADGLPGSFRPGATSPLVLEPFEATAEAGAGRAAVYNLTILNSGTTPLPVSVAAEVPTGWSANVTPGAVSVAPKAKATVMVQIAAPFGDLSGSGAARLRVASPAEQIVENTTTVVAPGRGLVFDWAHHPAEGGAPLAPDVAAAGDSGWLPAFVENVWADLLVTIVLAGVAGGISWIARRR